MLKPNDSVFDPEVKNRCPLPGVTFKSSFSLKPQQIIDSRDDSSNTHKKLKKSSYQQLSEEYSNSLSSCQFSLSKTGLSDKCCLSKHIEQGAKENERLLVEYQERENVLRQKLFTYEEEKETSKKLEEKLQILVAKKAEECSGVIQELNTKLNALNKRLGLYEDFLKLSVKKNKDDYICTANPGLSEFVFSFKFEELGATYTPIKTNLSPHDMLNFKLQNISKTEIPVIFNRLRKNYSELPNVKPF